MFKKFLCAAIITMVATPAGNRCSARSALLGICLAGGNQYRDKRGDI